MLVRKATAHQREKAKLVEMPANASSSLPRITGVGVYER